MATQTSVEQPIILYSTETVGPIGPRGPTAVSNTPGNLATLGNDFLILVPGAVLGNNASPTQVVKGNDTRLSDARTPTAHAVSHKSGGTDAVKLDELAAPTDVTTLNSSTTAHGLLRKLDGNINHVLQGDGTWGTPAGGGNMSKSDYDTNNDLIIDHAHLADSVPWTGVTGTPTRYFPAGMVMPFAGSTAPTGFLLCDGASYATATYPDLFTAIGYTYGGSGANFNVPDMRGRTAVGAGQGTGLANRVLAGKFGEENHPLTTGELASHNHTASQADHYHTISGGGNHAHGATMPDHQHGLPPFAHTHSDAGHTHTFVGPFGAGAQWAANPAAWGLLTTNTGTGFANIQSWTSPLMPTYYSSQYGGQPRFSTDASGAITPNTTYASQTMGAVPVVNVANTGSGTAHNNMQPSLFLNYVVST